MALSRVEQKVFIIKKEAVRGTAEASATGGRSLPVLPASEISINPNLLPNTKIFGDPEQRDAAGGVRDFTGTLELEPGADKLGELLINLLGKVVTDQPDVGGAPLVFRHIFTPDTDPQHPLHTLFIDRKTHQKKIEGLGVGQMTFTVPVDNRLAVSADVIGKTELAGAVLTPDFSTDLEDLIFSDVSVDIVGATSSQVRQASVQINNSLVAKRVLKNSRDAVDIVSGIINVTGTFQLYFEDDVERDKFVASSLSDIFILAQGQTLQATQKATLSLDMPRMKYSAGPIGEVDGILIQDFAFSAFRDPTLGASVQATLINKETGF